MSKVIAIIAPLMLSEARNLFLHVGIQPRSSCQPPPLQWLEYKSKKELTK
jgi:hypothetical protein